MQTFPAFHFIYEYTCIYGTHVYVVYLYICMCYIYLQMYVDVIFYVNKM